jgi:hypothetical protein
MFKVDAFWHESSMKRTYNQTINIIISHEYHRIIFTEMYRDH